MRFALSAEQRQFTATLHELLSAVPSGKAWPALVDLGLPALAVPGPCGGLGGDPIDLAVAFEELGHHAVPGPLIETLAAVPTLLAELDDRKWLPAMASGHLVATLACPPHVPHAVDADTAGLVLATDGDSVYEAAPTGTALSSVDPTRRLFAVSTTTKLATARPAIDRALDVGILACAAQLLGTGRAMLELTTEYATHRTQFGRPIAQFQAVQHRLADVLVGLELARPILFNAAIALTRRTPTATRDVSAAKVAAAHAAYHSARAALQVHGAIGYTLEYDLSRWLTMTRALMSAWGTSSMHRARVATSL